MAETYHEDDNHHTGNVISAIANNSTTYNNSTIDLNTPEWICIRVALIISIIIEVMVTAVIVDILYRKKLISGVVLRIVGSLTSGLMLSGGLVHIFAEAIEHYVESTDHPNYIIPTTICSVTILLLIVIDKTIHMVMEFRNDFVMRRRNRKRSSNKSGVVRNNKDVKNQVGDANEIIEMEIIKLDSTLESQNNLQKNARNSQNETNNECNHQGHFNATLVVDKWYVAVILLLAVGLHSFFAGLGFGTTRSVTIMFQVYAFIILHKGLVAASLAFVMLQYSAYFTRCRYYLLMLTFAVTTPIGAAIGLGFSFIDVKYELIEVVFNCISAGTFIYLAIKELIVMFFDSAETKYWIDIVKILAYLIGFSLLTGLAIWHPHEAIKGH